MTWICVYVRADALSTGDVIRVDSSGMGAVEDSRQLERMFISGDSVTLRLMGAGDVVVHKSDLIPVWRGHD